MHPVSSRKSARANAGRERRRVARHQLTASHERQMYDQEEAWMRAESRRSGRHFYGAWTPWGVSAFMGGHPGRGKKTPAARRRHLARLRDLGEA